MAADTVNLSDAARRLGISPSMAYRLARAGNNLTPGVRILRFGTAGRPVYRVSIAQLDAVLAPTTANAAGQEIAPPGTAA